MNHLEKEYEELKTMFAEGKFIDVNSNERTGIAHTMARIRCEAMYGVMNLSYDDLKEGCENGN